MKLTSTILAGMIAVTGLILAGSETQSIAAQFLIAFAGINMFAGGMFWLTRIHRR